MAQVTFVGTNTSLSGTGTGLLDGISYIDAYTASGVDDFTNPKLTSLSVDNNTLSPDNRSATLSISTNDLGEETITGLVAGFGRWDARSVVMTITGLSLTADLNGANPFDLANETEIQRLLNVSLMGDDTFTISGVISGIWGDIETHTGSATTTFGNDIMNIGPISAAAGVERPVFYGDASVVSADATIIAGSDRINASQAGIGVTIYGDFKTDHRVDPLSTTYGNDLLIGGVGNDYLYGDYESGKSGGNDVLKGGGGNDILFGGGGDDLLFGGTGSSIFYGGQGSDTVSLAKFRAGGIPSAREYMVLDLAHADRNSNLPASYTFASIENVIGRKFNSYGTDMIFGTNGENVIRSHGAISNFHGRGGDDILTGGNSFDRLFGGNGNDMLMGGRSNDFFVFDAKLDAAANVDRIRDFHNWEDAIWIDDRIMQGISKTKVNVDVDHFGSPEALAGRKFHASLDGKAHDATDRVLYDTDSGRLYFDADGTGGQHRVLFAILQGHPDIDASDFGIF